MDLLTQSSINPADITIQHLAKTADREDFLVRVRQAENDYTFRLSITGTILALWDVDPDEAAKFLIDRLVWKHGTAAPFKEEGYWFDSYNSSASFEQTVHDIENKGDRFFDSPDVKTGLGSVLFKALDDLDLARHAIDGQAFVRSLDVLFERSQAGDDFESEAIDHAHYIYRICLASAIVDRFNFEHPEGSLNGARQWLTERVGEARANELIEPFRQVKKLRVQYPIHEEYRINASGERTRRSELERAEGYFGISHEPTADWYSVSGRFVEALAELKAELEALEH